MMEMQNNKIHRDLARNLRKNLTTAEQQLWACLRKRQLDGFRFRRQTPLGRYIADFVCLEVRLVIELDGNHHHDQQGYDQARDDWMQQQRFRALRFWNHEIVNNQEATLQKILNALHRQRDTLLLPSPLAGEGAGMGGVTA
jgi:very-short-patch-repair endonuclease